MKKPLGILACFLILCNAGCKKDDSNPASTPNLNPAGVAFAI